MNFDDHEIWGAPVRASEATPETTAADPLPVPDAPRAGRLYRSAGSDPHPEAILALPNHRRHTAVHPLEATQWATPPAPAAPITINSRIPRPQPPEDPAIAEVLAAPVGASAAQTPMAGFTSWFKTPEGGAGREGSPLTRATGTGSEALGAVSSLRLSALSARGLGLLLFAVTTLVGIVDAVIAGTLGLPTGVALLAATGVGAWKVTAPARWSAWVMPAYALIGAIVIAGQFTASAPGASPIGQALLVVSGLIALAPWLAAATLLGVALPVVRGRRAD